MLNVREQQMEALALNTTPLQEAEAELVAHVRRAFPEQCQQLGEDRTHVVVLYGLGRALEHGFNRRQQIARYLNLMFLFGADFDRDPKLPWASQVLTEPSLKDELDRMDRLQRAAAVSLIYPSSRS